MQVHEDRGLGPALEESRPNCAETMLRFVLEGETYEAVASRFGVTRTAVERRIKSLTVRAASSVGIDGLNQDAATYVRRLRLHKPAVLAAVEALHDEEDAVELPLREVRILTEDEIASGARRIRARSQHALEDLALYFLLFATGARPLEIARLAVSDYLEPDGAVRRDSELRAEAAITGRARPLCFRSARLDEALDAYLAQRRERGLGLGRSEAYRGLDPDSRLFLGPSGQGFEITPYGEEGQRRYRCRAMQEAYRKLWRLADFKGLTALTVRHTVAARLYARGADETQVGLLLGISERSAVRVLFPRRWPSLEELTGDLV